MVTHPDKKVDAPKIIMLEVRIALVPYLSISQPTIGETNDDAIPPMLAAAAPAATDDEPAAVHA